MRDYNLFMSEEDGYDDDDDQKEDSATQLKHQKYSTWLYISLLTSKFDIEIFLLRVYFFYNIIVSRDKTSRLFSTYIIRLTLFQKRGAYNFGNKEFC